LIERNKCTLSTIKCATPYEVCMEHDFKK